MSLAPVSFKWFDVWIGAYFDRKNSRLYVCPLPCVAFEFQIGRTWREELAHCDKSGVLTKRLKQAEPHAHFCFGYDGLLITELGECDCAYKDKPSRCSADIGNGECPF